MFKKKKDKKVGIYLLGSCYFNPHTKEEFYCVKVGSSTTDLIKRVNQYFCSNPYFFKVSLKEMPKDNANEIWKKELACHEILEDISLTRCACDHTLEWFRVDRENYLEICDKGFAWFEDKGLEF